MFEDKTIVVTGGTGSLGQVLVKRILSGENGCPKRLIVLSRDEAKQNDMRIAYRNVGPTTDEVIYRDFEHLLEFRIGDVRSFADVCSALRGADIVINAAALKQVPTCEYFPTQAIATNCLGPENIVRAIHEHQLPIEAVIGISTDKACKPVNVMGMTKALQERILIAANVLVPQTRFLCVRYGNVLSSRGSVIPLFRQQIDAGGPVTLTSESMTRFLITLDNAADTVFAALAEGQRGETYVPKIPAARVADIARAMIGSQEIPIKIIGTRPGEKQRESLVSEEECRHVVERGPHYVIMPLLPELRTGEVNPVLVDEFHSSRNVMTAEETSRLLSDNGLIPAP